MHVPICAPHAIRAGPFFIQNHRGKDCYLDAIKILPEEFSRDAARVGRFQRQAEVLASLIIQNIGAIYDLEDADSTRFLVLELVEGETIAERIQRGPIPLDEGLDMSRQISEALEAAHEKGIVHRDLNRQTLADVEYGSHQRRRESGDRSLYVA